MQWVSIALLHFIPDCLIGDGDHFCNISPFLISICLIFLFYFSPFLFVFTKPTSKGDLGICTFAVYRVIWKQTKTWVEICTGITLCYVYMHLEAEIASKIININMWYHIILYYRSISLMWTFLPEMPFFFMQTQILKPHKFFWKAFVINT